MEIKFSGVGIHSGKTVNVRLILTESGGIVFVRTDLPNAVPIPATYENVHNTGMMSTNITKNGNTVQTIEHFMAALFICGIYNARVEIDGPEFPIMDGGSKQFLDILACGVRRKTRVKKIIIKREIIVTRQEVIKQLPFAKRFMLWLHGLKTGRREDGFVKLSPDKGGLVLDVVLDYPDKQIGRQQFEFTFDGTKAAYEFFAHEISPSRTFGRYWEWEYLKKRKMGQGADGKNLIVLMNDGDWEKLEHDSGLGDFAKYCGDKTLTPLHFPDEFVRHKLIDAIGDLALSGGFIVGRFTSVKGSHAMNNLLLRKLFSNIANYDVIEN